MLAVCINASAQNLIHLNCEGSLVSKYKSQDFNNTTNIQIKESVTIDANTGRVLEGTSAEGIIKIPTFSSTVSDTRFRGSIDTSKISEKQIDELKIAYLQWYYSFDRYSGNYKVKSWYRKPPINRGNTRWDEWDSEENGHCVESAQKKF